MCNLCLKEEAKEQESNEFINLETSSEIKEQNAQTIERCDMQDTNKTKTIKNEVNIPKKTHEEYLYKINESLPTNAFLLARIKEAGSLRKLAKMMDMYYVLLSNALHKKPISNRAKIKIAKYFNKDTIEIFN